MGGQQIKAASADMHRVKADSGVRALTQLLQTTRQVWSGEGSVVALEIACDGTKDHTEGFGLQLNAWAASHSTDFPH